MKSDYLQHRLGDIAKFAYGKMPKKKLLGHGIYPTFSGYKYQHTYPESNCQKGDVIVVARGVGGTGDVKIVREESYLTNLSIKVDLDNSMVDNRFFYYRFLNTGLKHLDSGSAQSQITINDLKNEFVALPSLEEQKAIAHILGTLDDKIELNRQMNATLEAMAQALFKSWFVDFDPVIDNALATGNPIPEPLQAGADARKVLGDKRKPLPEEIRKQFPSSFVFTEEMGWVPEGWKSQPVYDVANFINGASFKAKHFSPDGTGLPVVKIAEIKNGITGQTKFSTDEFDDKYRIGNGDILFSWSGNPDTSIDTFLWSNGPGWLNQHIFKVLVSDQSEQAFAYYLLKFLKPTFAEIARDKQTTGLGHVTAGDMKRLFVIRPERAILRLFQDQAGAVMDRWFSNVLASNYIALVRDALLPKLLSGQLRIPEAEQQVAEVL